MCILAFLQPESRVLLYFNITWIANYYDSLLRDFYKF